jgi:hypothetical protein
MGSIIEEGCDNAPSLRPRVTGLGHTPRVDPIDDGTAAPDLNPAQQAVLDQLGATVDERPEFAEDLRHHLRSALETAVEPHLDGLPTGEDLFVHKHRLAQVHGCETNFLAGEAEDFEWKVPTARIPTLGWFIIPIPNSPPNIPGLVTVNVEPNISSGFSLFSRARLAKSAVDRASPRKFFSSDA